LLYADEIDTRSGSHLVDFPQVFTRLPLINTVMHLLRLEGKAAWRH
jgi:hypothetical protein